MDAPPLPRSRDELGAWGVYSDWLLEHRPDDWRTAIIALELATPADANREALRRFQRVARRLHFAHGIARGVATFGWCLTHIRTLRVRPNVSSWLVPRAVDAVEELLRDPVCARLEEFLLDANVNEPLWGRLLPAVPGSCTRVVLRAADLRLDTSAVVGALPSHVRTLALERSPFTWPLADVDARLVDDRFDELDFRRTALSPVARMRITAALGSTRRVRVRLGAIDASPPTEIRDRLLVGAPEDLVLRDDAGAVVVLPQPSLLVGQYERGLLPAALQVARAFNVRWGLRVRDGVPRVRPRASLVVRRDADGTMSVRVGRADPLFERVAVAVNGRRLRPFERAPLGRGDRLRLEGREWNVV